MGQYDRQQEYSHFTHLSCIFVSLIVCCYVHSGLACSWNSRALTTKLFSSYGFSESWILLYWHSILLLMVGRLPPYHMIYKSQNLRNGNIHKPAQSCLIVICFLNNISNISIWALYDSNLKKIFLWRNFTLRPN